MNVALCFECLHLINVDISIALVQSNVYVMRKVRIGTIRGYFIVQSVDLYCIRTNSKFRSMLCRTSDYVNLISSRDLSLPWHIIVLSKNTRGEIFLLTKKAGSKTICPSKGDKIISFLSGESTGEDTHFRSWVKSCGFRLMDYPALGLKNILCMPANVKACSFMLNCLDGLFQ